MKKLINSKKAIQKMFMVIILILMFNFIMPNYSQADFGGVLAKPITDIFSALGDAVCAGLQFFLVDGNFLIGNGGIISAFLTSSDEQGASDGTWPDDKYESIRYNSSTGVSEYTFDTKDIDLEGWDGWKEFWGTESIGIPVTKYTPEAIFAGEIPALDINFINPKVWESNEENERSVAKQLHETVATWYVALRNLAIIGLMIVLVYVGIRMVISSAASDKAKYKQLFMDWLIAMCLLFCLHYIMSFTITITQEITNAIRGSANSVNTIPVTVYKDGDTSNAVAKFNTSLTGIARFHTKMDDGGTRLLFTIIYLALVIYTVMFTFTYLKRVITMAFLTLIAPLVALTYPIDKMNDGKAQAFDSWLKEYIFNALLQPFHLIIYTVFVGSAMDLAAKNPIYAIVALAFITPAEKILRKFFGFGKAETAGNLGSFASMAGGAAVINGMKKILSPKKGSGSSGGKGIKTKGGVKGSVPSIGDVYGGDSGGNSGDNNSETPALESATQAEDDTVRTADTEGTQASSVPTHQADENGNNPSVNPTGEGTGGWHGEGAWKWNDNDERGLGQWAADAAKYGANWLGTNTGVGRGVVKFGRKVGDGATKVRDMAKSQAQKVGDWGRRTIPKPLRNTARTLGNTAKGVGNVALQTGLSVGKTALKAAPGAMLGLAAGIAGDDLEDIWKYTAAGGALSSTIGSSSVAQAGAFIANTYNEGAHGSVAGQLEQRRRAFESDENNQLLAKSMYPNASKSEIKSKMRKASYYDSIGIEGKDAFKAVTLEKRLRDEMMKQGKAEDDAEKLAQKKAAVIADIAKDYSKKDLKDKDEVMNLRNDLSSKLGKAGLKGDEKKNTVESLVTEIKAFKGVSNNY